MKIMVCTDGSSSSIQSAEMVGKFGFPADTWVTVLGVSEGQADLTKLNSSMDLIDKALGTKYKLDKIIRRGNPTDEIISEALETPYDLVVVGGGKGQLNLLHPQLGSTAAKLARKLHTHFLVTRNIPEKITKILVCIGSDVPSSRTMELGGKWISNTSAQVGILHVFPKVNESDVKMTNSDNKPKEPELFGSGSTDPILMRANQMLLHAGVKNEITTRIRHGLVVEEVIKELSMGSYELLVVGAHYQPGQDRWQETLLDDVTDQLLNRSTCSVLII